VVGKKLHTPDPTFPIKPAQEPQKSRKVTLGIGDPGDNGDADDHVFSTAHFHKPGEVFQNPNVADSGEAPMLLRIPKFQIEKEKVRRGRDSLENFRLSIAGGVEGGMDPAAFAFLEGRKEEFRLKKGLPAGKSNPAARTLVQNPVPLEHL
jgi:hypothetical protein